MFSITSNNADIEHIEESEPRIMLKIKYAYSPHDRIHITSDSNFSDEALANGWSGNGSETNPYIIKGLNITSDETCIRIDDTTVHFTISQCFLSSYNEEEAGIGIYLDHAPNGVVNSCLITLKYHGLRTLTAHNTTVFNNTFLDNTYGMYLAHAWYSNITNNSFQDGGTQCLDSTSHCTFVNNTFQDKLSLVYSDNCTFYGNKFQVSSGLGLSLTHSANCKIINNQFHNGGLSVEGIELEDWHQEIINTTVDGIEIGYFWNLTDTILDCNLYSQIILGNSSDITIQNENFGVVPVGPQIGYCNNITLENSIIDSKYFGIRIDESFRCTIHNNTISADDNGIIVLDTPNSTISNNTIFNCFGIGIDITRSENCTICNNTAFNNTKAGLALYSISYSDILSNEVYENSECGIYCEESENCTLYHNNVYSNLEFGIFFRDMDNTTLSNNLIQNNSEIGIQIIQSYNCVIHANSFVNDGLLLTGSTQEEWHCDISNNIVNGKELGYFWDMENITVDGSLYGEIIIANCTGVDIQGGLFKDSTCGIEIGYSNNCNLYDSMISSCYFGYYSSMSENCSIINCTITENELACTVFASHNSVIANSSIYDSNAMAIYCAHSINCTFQNNVLVNSEITIMGTTVDYWSHSFIDNTVNGKELGYFWNLTDSVIDCSEYGQMILANCSNVFVENGIFNSMVMGIQIAFCNNCTVFNTTLSDNYHVGIYAVQSNNCNFLNNTSSGNQYTGIYCEACNNSTISYNKVFSNEQYGIKVVSGFLGWCENNTIYGNSIGWNGVANAFNDGNNLWDDNISLGNSWNDYDGSGTYIIEGFFDEATDRYPSLLSDAASPTIDSPLDITFEKGTIGNILTWKVSDAYPISYQILQDSTEIESGFWGGNTITICVDDLDDGTYNYTLIVKDAAGNTASDSIFVIVANTMPEIDHPEDITYLVGTTGHSITWHPTDTTPTSYQILVNGTIAEEGLWNGSSITISVDELNPGTYNYTLVVQDASGNTASDSVIVMVTEIITGTATTTTTTQSSFLEILQLWLIYIIPIGFVLVVIVVVYVSKKRQS